MAVTAMQRQAMPPAVLQLVEHEALVFKQTLMYDYSKLFDLECIDHPGAPASRKRNKQNSGDSLPCHGSALHIYH
jgi:hypothetical protein